MKKMAVDQGVPLSWNRGWAVTGAFAAAYIVALAAAHLCATGTLLGSNAPLLDGDSSSSSLAVSTLRASRDWLSSWATLGDMPQEERLRLLFEENAWKNSLVMWALPAEWREALPHVVQTWLRCVVLCAAVYFITGAAWCYYVYHCFGDVLFAPGTLPGARDVLEQIKVSCLSIPLYSVLPALTEYAGEQGWTKAYPRVDNVGLPMYAIYFVLYMTSVEFGVYWMHRGLHEIKLGYKLLHSVHHKYNKEHTLSPFAGLAFHPLDGIMQAIPYTWTMFFCPMHFLTHEMLLFATGVWTTNIHDCLHGKVWPIMGAGYHTIHHTTYKHNYGHYFVFIDAMYNTMVTPEQYELDLQATKGGASSAAAASKSASQQQQSESDDGDEDAGSSKALPVAGPTSRAAGKQAKADATALVSPRRGGIKTGKAQ